MIYYKLACLCAIGAFYVSHAILDTHYGAAAIMAGITAGIIQLVEE